MVVFSVVTFDGYAQVQFDIDLNPPLTSEGTVRLPEHRFAVNVVEHSPPQQGFPTNVLGAPDYPGGPLGNDFFVDFNGFVTLEFDQVFADGPGADLALVGVQLDEVEGFDLFVGPAPDTLTFVGTFEGSPSG
ncbi:MAG: hypothetical protein AAF492_16695, partial [Verrucomicrobiota bacterium]